MAINASDFGGGGLPRLTSVTQKALTGYVSGGVLPVASLAAGSALTTVLNITTPLSIGSLHIDSTGPANTIDRMIVTTDQGVLYDGAVTYAANGASWFIGQMRLMTNGSTNGYALFQQSFRCESLKIELDTTGSAATSRVFSDLELIL